MIGMMFSKKTCVKNVLELFAPARLSCIASPTAAMTSSSFKNRTY